MKARKQFLVVGLGRFGSSAARTLTDLGHEVLAVDSREDAVEDVSADVTQAVQADATDEETLRSFGLSNFDGAIIAIGSNIRDSILICSECKEAGIPFVGAKAQDDRHAKVLRKVGADRVFFPERDMGERVARSIVMPHMLDLLSLPDGYQLADITAPAAWVGRTLVDINVRRTYGVSVIAVRRGGRMLVSPTADFAFEADDVMMVLAHAEDIERMSGKIGV